MKVALSLLLNLGLLQIIAAQSNSNCWKEDGGVCTSRRKCSQGFYKIPPWKDGQRRCPGRQTCCLPSKPLPPRFFDSDTCGLSGAKNDANLQIINGVEAKHHQYPWFVSLAYADEHFCGGSILANNWILTAAHCLDDLKPEQVTIRAGLINSTEWAGKHNPAYQASIAEKFKVFQRYRPKRSLGDIALIKLKTPLQFNQAVHTVCLPNPESRTLRVHPSELVDEIVINEEGEIQKMDEEVKYAADEAPFLLTESVPNFRKEEDEVVFSAPGYGITETGFVPVELRTVNLPGLPLGICAWLLSPARIYESNLCAGFYEGGRDTCQGDSGGPLTTLVRDQSDRPRAVINGVVSWGVGCAELGLPGMTTRVTTYLGWIDFTTRLPLAYKDGRYATARNFVLPKDRIVH